MKRRGVARILEAVFSAILVIEAIAVSYYLLIPPNPSVARSHEELSRFGYSLMTSLAYNNGFDKLLFNDNGQLKKNWETDLKVVVDSLLPQNVIFNITVYNATKHNVTINNITIESVKFVKLNKQPISNTLNEITFIRAGENVQITYVYTTYLPQRDQIEVFLIVMKLAILRGA